MNQVLDNPAAWRGTELLSRPDWLHRLQPEELDELNSAQQQISAENIALEELNKETIALPRLSRVLLRVQDSLENGSGAALIRGSLSPQQRGSS